MASPPSSRLRFLRRRGDIAVDAPVEWDPTWLVLDVPATDWSSASVTWNRSPLELQQRRSTLHGLLTVAELPRLPAGNHRFRLAFPGGVEDRIVRVAPRKLDEPAFEQMLEDLQQQLAQEVALALQDAGALEGVQVESADAPTLAGERRRLRRAILGEEGRPGLLSLLPRIAAAPHEQLTREHRWTPALAARNVVPSRLAEALLRPGNVDDNGGLSAVVEARPTSSFDTYENRVIRTFVELVRARASRFLAACEALRKGPLVAETLAWVKQLDLARSRAAFLTDVSPLPVAPSRATMFLSRTPAYRAAFEGLLAFVRGCSIRCDASWLDSPLENLPALYQLWGTLQVIVAVLEHATSLGFVVRRQRLVVPMSTGLYVQVLPDGKPALVLEHPCGLVVTVTPELEFGRTSALHSITYPQRPDITIELRHGEDVELWLFDPKYKLWADADAAAGDGRPTKEDLDKMHAYRDAIRTCHGRHVVKFAAIIYPGPTTTYGADLAAVQGWPGNAGELRDFVAGSVGRRLAVLIASLHGMGAGRSAPELAGAPAGLLSATAGLPGA
jgi:hypothetical protein